jgi:hypothetical protein
MLAIRIIDERPDYHIIENNCQNFAKFLLKFMCPSASIPDTIQDLFERWQRFPVPASSSNQFLPGAYPPSSRATDSTSFITASEMNSSIASEDTWAAVVQYLMCHTDDNLDAMYIPLLYESLKGVLLDLIFSAWQWNISSLNLRFGLIKNKWTCIRNTLLSCLTLQGSFTMGGHSLATLRLPVLPPIMTVSRQLQTIRRSSDIIYL